MAALTTSLPVPHSHPNYLVASNPKLSSPKFSFRRRNQLSFAIATIPIKRRQAFSIYMALNPAQQERVIIPNKDGEKLVGILHDTGSKEIVVVCHGFTSSKNEKTMVNLATRLEAEGISAFRFDFSGNGESEGSFAYGNYAKEADDIDAVVKHFNGANRVVCAVVGHSKGGDDVLVYASKFHDIPTIVNLSGRYNLKRGISERLGEDFMERLNKEGYIDVEKGGKDIYRVTKESMVERLNTNMQEVSEKIDEYCRVLTVHGSADEIIPVEDAYEFAKIVRNHKLHIVEGADHCYNNHQEELVSVVVDFIKACIQQDNDTVSRIAMCKAYILELIDARDCSVCLEQFQYVYDLLSSDVIPVAPPFVRASHMHSHACSANSTIFDRAESFRMAEERAAAQQASTRQTASQPTPMVPPVWASGVDSGIGVSLASDSPHLAESLDSET